MLSSTASRVLLKQINANTFNGQTVRLMSCLTPPTPKKEERRQVHSSPPRKADASAVVEETPTAVETKAENGLYNRFVVTAEVAVSKIFPAGFMWQTSSIIASESFGFAPDTMNFALTTGRK
jgi:hypothetical protein